MMEKLSPNAMYQAESIVCRIHYSVLDALVAHFIRFVDDIRVTHVIHLAPVSSYFCATLEVQVRTNKEYKEHFQTLLKKQSTILITLRLVDWISLAPNELESKNNQGMWIER
ncbi:hypothetical protein YC2023_099468 [Brassica napus]